MSELGSELDPMQQSSLEFPPEAPTPDASPPLPATDGPFPKVEAQPASPALRDVVAFQTAGALPVGANMIEILTAFNLQLAATRSLPGFSVERGSLLETNLILTQIRDAQGSPEVALLIARLPADLRGPVRRALHIEEQPGEAVLSEHSTYIGPEVPDVVSQPLRKILGDKYRFGKVDAPLFRKILDASRSAQHGLVLDLGTARFLYDELVAMGNAGKKVLETEEFQELQFILTRIMNPKPTKDLLED